MNATESQEVYPYKYSQLVTEQPVLLPNRQWSSTAQFYQLLSAFDPFLATDLQKGQKFPSHTQAHEGINPRWDLPPWQLTQALYKLLLAGSLARQLFTLPGRRKPISQAAASVISFRKTTCTLCLCLYLRMGTAWAHHQTDVSIWVPTNEIVLKGVNYPKMIFSCLIAIISIFKVMYTNDFNYKYNCHVESKL